MPDVAIDPIDEARRRLLAAARRGDREASAELLRSLQDTVYRFCLTQLRDPESAADATQETGLRLLGAFRRFEGRGRVSTWALGVALNVCRETRRRTRHGAPLESVEDPVARQANADEHSERREEAERLRAALQGLTPRRREAVVLRYFEQLSMEETAAAMGCSVGAAKATIWQALRRLRDALTRETITP